MKFKSILSIAGITAILLYMVFSLIAFLYFPTAYSPFANWLSDLGNPTKNPSGAIFYKLSGILTSIALVPFFWGSIDGTLEKRKLEFFLPQPRFREFFSRLLS